MNDKILYNDSNDNAKQTWELGGEEVSGEIVEKVDLSTAEILTVPGCKHENHSRTQSLEFDNCDEIKCNDCPVGFLVRHEA